MLRVISTGIIIFITYLLQVTLLPSLDFVEVVPNLLLIVCFSMALLRGSYNGLMTGLACGMFLDLFSSNTFGFYTLIYMYMGYFTGLFNQRITVDVPYIPIIFTIISELFYNFYIFFFSFFLRGRINFVYYFNTIVLPEITITIIVALFYFIILYKINDKIEENEKRRELKFV